MAKKGEISAGKRLKGGGHDESTAVDRISNLPEEIIYHILSFLPTKSAAATNFLSKLWMLRGTKFTVLDFDDKMWPGKSSTGIRKAPAPVMRFVEFVNMVLFKYTAESIYKFTLVWHLHKFQSTYLNMWVDLMIARNIRVLDLSVESEITDNHERHEFNLPSALFCCGTIEILILGRNFFIQLPLLVCLPKLTVLDLFSVKHESDESFHKLISGCPRLQSLFIERTHFDGLAKVYTISSATLKCLQMSFYYCDCADELEMGELKVNIDAPALETLIISSDVAVELAVLGPTSAKKVELDFESYDGIVEFVQKFDCLKFLNLSPRTVNVLSSAPIAPNQLSTSFGRLTSLAVDFTADQWDCLLDMINCCTKLEVLELTKVPSYYKCWMGRISVPRCFSSSLRRVSFKHFTGLEDEMCMLSLILQHGLLIETVTLCSRSYASSRISCDQKLQIQNKVLQLSRASPACKVSFSWGGSGCLHNAA